MSERVIEVVAGVITDKRGRILLSRRTPNRDMPGLWEFPGGKREAGETPEAALIRELDEELGIRVTVGPPLMTVPQQYPSKRLRLDVRHVTHWDGVPKGREGQALAWVAPGKLSRYSMPPADLPVVAALQAPDRYLVTPPPGDDDAPWLQALEQALRRGIRRIQLRLPGVPVERQHLLLQQAAIRCRRRDAQLLFNGPVDLALAAGVGVHLRSDSLRTCEGRPVPDGVLLAASCHDAEELAHAARLGCDFVVLGPVAETASHPGAPGIGWTAFARLRETSALPIYALGGMTPDDIPEARRHGAQGIAAIRSLWAPD
ncbi:Nudix family hydrolase [Luteimonas sp. 3794]|uniref:Nudix family hydrolase n=1 Tax=Luteimonas sp. 3794 TaxID=2817730 RepID=UPI002854BF0C|nr:Nudix family hydrolase [Luteimonas sp. 3794]MDR6991170.1 8-oxo-dGTP diphosphatase [Luteimonas sp. 3794]